MPDGIGGAEGLHPSQQELGNKPPQNSEQALSGPAEAITSKIGFFRDNPHHALNAIAGTPPEQSATGADSNIQGERKRRAGFTSPDLEPPITAGSNEPSQEQPAPETKPSDSPETPPSETAGQQNPEQSADERLAAARKEFDKNVQELNQNLAQLGSSGVEPGQGSPATQEKWKYLEKATKLSAIAAAGIIGLDGAFTAADYLTGGQYQLTSARPIFTAGLSLLGTCFALTVGKEVMRGGRTESQTGWEKLKKWVLREESQEATPK